MRILKGDCLAILRTLPSRSIQACVTSPPYFQLRDNLTATWTGGDAQCDHRKLPKKQAAKPVITAQLIGNRRSTGRHYEVDATSHCKCGATWADDQIGQEETAEQYVTKLVQVFREVRRVLRDDGTLWLNLGDTRASNWPCRRRNRIGARSLENGKRENRPPRLGGDLKDKDLIGVPWMLAFALRADGWYLRSDIIWHKANNLPDGARDRPTACHEHVFLLSKSKTYYYDSESIAEDCANSSEFSDKKNARDVWVIAPKPCTLAHFAVMPLDLAERCVKAGSSQYGCCSVCGAPWIRQMKGWAPSCKCRDDPTPCKVLDPFAGAGTTGLAALRHGRNAVLIELNSEYYKIMEQRLAGEAIGTFD